jgi:uncharacterized protein (TIGR03067 family)
MIGVNCMSSLLSGLPLANHALLRPGSLQSLRPAGWVVGRFLAPRMDGQFTISSQIPANLLSNRMTLEAMKLLRHIITVVCVVASFANADELPTDKAKGPANQPTNAELQLLQGTWEGFSLSRETPDGPIVKATNTTTITITGDSFRFHRDTNFWFETTITLPAGKDPKQLHATIKGCPPSQESSIGQVVRAFFKIENGTLTLATIGDDTEETPKGFEATEDKGQSRYELRKVQKKNIEPPKTK